MVHTEKVTEQLTPEWLMCPNRCLQVNRQSLQVRRQSPVTPGERSSPFRWDVSPTLFTGFEEQKGKLKWSHGYEEETSTKVRAVSLCPCQQHEVIVQTSHRQDWSQNSFNIQSPNPSSHIQFCILVLNMSVSAEFSLHTKSEHPVNSKQIIWMFSLPLWLWKVTNPKVSSKWKPHASFE